MRVPPRREPQGVMEQLDAIVTEIRRRHERGEDIGLRELNKIFRQNELAAARQHRLYHYLGPTNGRDMPETVTDWHGDPAVAHEPGAEQGDHGWYPVCSCGFRALLSSGTEESALRRARVHAEVSTPQPESRYLLEAYDGAAVEGYEPRVYLYCREHARQSLLLFTGLPDEHQEEIAAAMREHEREHHGGDCRP